MSITPFYPNKVEKGEGRVASAVGKEDSKAKECLSTRDQFQPTHHGQYRSGEPKNVREERYIHQAGGVKGVGSGGTGDARTLEILRNAL